MGEHGYGELAGSGLGFAVVELNAASVRAWRLVQVRALGNSGLLGAPTPPGGVKLLGLQQTTGHRVWVCHGLGPAKEAWWALLARERAGPDHKGQRQCQPLTSCSTRVSVLWLRT